MASSAWRGALSFGLLTIPIRLYPAARNERVNLHQIHSVCHTRLRQPLYCPTCKRMVERSEVIRGFEEEDGKYVLVQNEDLKKITPQSSRVMEILAFVKGSQIDPIYFDSSYLALPEKDNAKPYVLLLKALEDSDRAGIAKVGYGKVDRDIKLKPQEVKLAEQLVESLSEDFKPQKYHDTFQENLKALMEAKREGKTVVQEPAAKRAPVVDMMEALKRSVRESEEGKRKKMPTRMPVAGRGRESRRRLAS